MAGVMLFSNVLLLHLVTELALVFFEGVVIFENGDNEELSEIKTHGLSDHSDSVEQLI